MTLTFSSVTLIKQSGQTFFFHAFGSAQTLEGLWYYYTHSFLSLNQIHGEQQDKCFVSKRACPACPGEALCCTTVHVTQLDDAKGEQRRLPTEHNGSWHRVEWRTPFMEALLLYPLICNFQMRELVELFEVTL